MLPNENRSIEEELALFEKEISSVESSAHVNGNVTNQQSVPIVNGSAPSNSSRASVPSTSIGPSVQAPSVIGPFTTQAPIVVGPLPGPRAAPPPFLPHVMLRPNFIPPTSLAMRFMPPQLRIPVVNLMRPMMQAPPQPAVLESGPTLYNEKGKDDKKDDSKEEEPGPSGIKAQVPQWNPVLASDMETVQRRQAEMAHRHGSQLRNDKKPKTFLRCGGGQCWEDRSLAEWDPNDFRIFCGDLGNEVSDELLAKAFRKYPSFQKAKVIREARTNKSKGYGFVSFKHQDDFVRACREMDGKYVGNRPIKLRKSNWKERNLDVVKKKKKQKQKLGFA